MYLGCTVPVRNLNYELSACAVAKKLDINFQDIEGFGCCGYPLKSLNVMDSLMIAARNLAVAQREGKILCALCNACSGTLTEAAHILDHNEKLRIEINEKLEPVGLQYEGGVQVKHFMRLLWENIGKDFIANQITNSLAGIRLAPHYGCHYLKPSELTLGFDSPDDPHTMTQLLEITGAEVIEYPSLKECCGGGVLGSAEETANAMAKVKLNDVYKAQAHALVLVCPFCNVMYEGQQKKIAKSFAPDLKVPIVYYPQILGLALGISSEDLGFKLNRVKPTELLRLVGA